MRGGKEKKQKVKREERQEKTKQRILTGDDGETVTIAVAAAAALAELREEVGSRFAGERKRLMYDRRRKERSQQSGTTGGVIPG